MQRKKVDGPHEGVDAYIADVPAVQPDSGVHVPKIMNPDPLIFPAKLRLAIEYYLDTMPRNRKIAAEKANMDPEEFDKHFRSPGVYQYIQALEAKIDEAACELRAKARVLCEDYLDRKTIEFLEAAGEKATAPRAKMIETGYKRFGMLIDKVENTGKGGAPLAFQIIRLGQKKSPDA
jgi:hypothetical protein